MTPALREVLDRARREGDFDPLLQAIPYMRFLGLHAVTRDGDLLVRMQGAERLVGNPVLPALHGGTVGALMESTAILKLLWESDSIGIPKTITLTVDYLRSPRVVETWGRAIITRLGRRVANVQVHAWQGQEDRPIAVAHAHFLLRSRDD
jgi:acyl-coenzyme A thioesterase PaaI-like protein